MNSVLTEQIILHILSNLLVIKPSFIDLSISKPLNSKEFLLKETIDFEIDDEIIKANVYGCQGTVQQQNIKILLTEFIYYPNLDNCHDKYHEHYLVVNLQDNPSYGLHVLINSKSGYDSEPLIGVSLNNKDWMACNTYLQATFLAAMENIKELGISWNKCSNYSNEYDSLLSFIKFQDSHEGKDER